MTAPVCAACTLALQHEVRHGRQRLCCEVRADRKYKASERGKASNRAAQARWRERRGATPASCASSPDARQAPADAPSTAPSP